MYVELKTHRNDQASTKERIALSPEESCAMAESRSHSQPSIPEEELVDRTRALISKHGLERTLRTEYYRTAFEDKQNQDYRASLDSDVTFSRERKHSIGQSQWARSATCTETGFRFPFAVLELKVAHHALEGSAEFVNSWITELIEEGGAIEVSKFSKYLTGYAAYNRGNVEHIPSWMSEQAVSLALQAQFPRTRSFAEAEEAMKLPGKLFDRSKMKEKERGPKPPDTKMALANERTLLAWIRTTMLLL